MRWVGLTGEMKELSAFFILFVNSHKLNNSFSWFSIAKPEMADYHRAWFVYWCTGHNVWRSCCEQTFPWNRCISNTRYFFTVERWKISIWIEECLVFHVTLPRGGIILCISTGCGSDYYCWRLPRQLSVCGCASACQNERRGLCSASILFRPVLCLTVTEIWRQYLEEQGQGLLATGHWGWEIVLPRGIMTKFTKMLKCS